MLAKYSDEGRGAGTRACRAGTLAGAGEQSSPEAGSARLRREESRRGRHECPRHEVPEYR